MPASKAAASPNRLSRMKTGSRYRVNLGFDDGDGLAFGNHFVDFDQYRLDFP
jgi:hypothetical protein